MFIRRLFFLLCIYIVSCGRSYAQGNDFCNAVNVILRDAPNHFRNVKGRMTESNMNATMWASGISVPGSISTRFVFSMGLFYECAFYQTRDKAELLAVYNKYKEMISGCLQPQGYKLYYHDNFYPGLADYKKLVFMQELEIDPKADTVTTHVANTAPPHITMEADYSKESGKYTIMMFIFEH